MKPRLSELQKASLVRAVRAQGGWIRALSSGERVTLASLYGQGLLNRRAHRGEEGEANAAYEYQPVAYVFEGLDQPVPKGVGPWVPPTSGNPHEADAGHLISARTGPGRAWVSVYAAKAQGVNVDPGNPWITICQAHGTSVGSPTRILARAAMHNPAEWCEDCRVDEGRELTH